MKQLIKNYTFNPAARTIVFKDYTSLALEGLLMITNISNSGKPVLYQFNDSGLTATVVGNVVILGYNTTLMNVNDDLQIFYDDASSAATDASVQLLMTLSENIDTSVELLKRIARVLEPVSIQDSAQRQKVTIDAITGSLTLSTVSTVSNVQSLGGIDYRWQMIDQARNTYANGIRANIKF